MASTVPRTALLTVSGPWPGLWSDGLGERPVDARTADSHGLGDLRDRLPLSLEAQDIGRLDPPTNLPALPRLWPNQPPIPWKSNSRSSTEWNTPAMASNWGGGPLGIRQMTPWPLSRSFTR